MGQAGCVGDRGRRRGLPGLSGLSRDGTSFRPMRGELIGDDVGVLTLGSLSSDCLVSAAALPLSGLISSTVMSLDLAERGLSVV